MRAVDHIWDQIVEIDLEAQRVHSTPEYSGKATKVALEALIKTGKAVLCPEGGEGAIKIVADHDVRIFDSMGREEQAARDQGRCLLGKMYIKVLTLLSTHGWTLREVELELRRRNTCTWLVAETWGDDASGIKCLHLGTERAATYQLKFHMMSREHYLPLLRQFSSTEEENLAKLGETGVLSVNP